ncbi:hypothetical protein [Rhizobium sp. FKY42]|uniref:hypothetical protein n=1 Tax=Rhizobium sp. FKY42 TaxID=2562310 RepID=UPI0010BFC68A|nr:hypothetical protein [Rhizobium sp. FKY42]
MAGRNLPEDWIEFASDWEQGYTSRGVDVDGMAGALLNALTHAMYDSKIGSDPAVSDTFRPVLTSAIDYLAGLIAADADPWSIPRRLPSSAGTRASNLHEVAHASLARERSHYARALASALKVQLSVPIAGTKRRMDLDAVFMTEVEFTGMLKVLLRRDTTAPLGRGYPIWGLYRPTLSGTGFDMTISTDPAVGIDLKRLWIEIELAEEKAWFEYEEMRGPAYGRPREPVRSSMYSFKEEPPICVPSREPWWEGRPLYSLIAAPKSVVIGEERLPGTRLEWSQILELIWQLYAPVQNLPLRRYEKPDESAWHLLNSPPAAARRVLVNARTELYGVRLCLSPTTDGAPIAWSPVVAASLAAFVDVGRVDMARLPTANEFDVIEARGGIIIVTSRGMLLLEVASGADFPLRELDRAARDVAATLDCARAIADHIDDTIRPLVIKAIDTGSSTYKRKALKAIYGAKLKARQAWAQSARFEEDVLVRQFRELCERRWNGFGRLTAALDEVAELESMVVSSSDVRAAATLNAIAVVGFPLSICGNLLGGLLIANEELRSVDGVVWPVLGIYLVASAVILAIVWAAAKISDRQWQPDRYIE